MPSEVLIDRYQQVGDHHSLRVKLQKIPASKKRPDGFKLNCVLIDLRINKAVLILDNHAPFGYHIHPEPQTDHTIRDELVVDDPFEAIRMFQKKVTVLTSAAEEIVEETKNGK